MKVSGVASPVTKEARGPEEWLSIGLHLTVGDSACPQHAHRAIVCLLFSLRPVIIL